jgi:hypothetical protein
MECSSLFFCATKLEQTLLKFTRINSIYISWPLGEFVSYKKLHSGLWFGTNCFLAHSQVSILGDSKLLLILEDLLKLLYNRALI